MKRRTALIAATIAALVLGGILGGNIFASKQAEEEVGKALFELGLEPYISYSNVSHSILSGETSIENVSVTGSLIGSSKIQAADITISDLELHNGELNSLTLSVNGFDVPVLEIARDCEKRRCLFKDAAFDLIELGYYGLSGGLHIAFKADPAQGPIRLKVSGVSEQIGKASVALEVQQVDAKHLYNSLITAFAAYEEVKESNFAALSKGLEILSGIKKSVGEAKLASMEIKLDDRGYLSRLRRALQFDDLNLDPPDEFAKSFAEWAYFENSYRFGLNDLPRKQKDDIQSALLGFFEKGGNLTVNTRLEQPIKILRTGGFFGIKPTDEFSSVGRFLYASNASVTSE